MHKHGGKWGAGTTFVAGTVLHGLYGVSYELVQINLANGTHFRGITLIDGNYLLFDGLGVGGKDSLRLQWVFSNFDFGTYFVYSLWYAPSTSRKKKPTEFFFGTCEGT